MGLNIPYEVINVGPSYNSNEKVINFDLSKFKHPHLLSGCSNFNDTFKLTILDKNTINVKRIDSNTGWGQNLDILITEASTQTKIPKIIHQIWIGDKSKQPVELMKTWETMNPTWEYKLWTEENIPELFNKDRKSVV